MIRLGGKGGSGEDRVSALTPSAVRKVVVSCHYFGFFGEARWAGFWSLLVSADDRDSVGVEDHARGGFVGAGQVVEVFAVGVAARVGHLLVLLHAHHQALVTDRLHVILVAVGRLVQGTLRHTHTHRGCYSKTAGCAAHEIFHLFLPNWTINCFHMLS